MVNEKTSTKFEVLKILRSASREISGNHLAELCGVSRVSVWKAVQTLTASGYAISCNRNGYRLEQDIKDSLYPWEFDSSENNFHHFIQTESTMTEAKKIALSITSPLISPKVITADSQTQGRGHGEHKWSTTKGSLAFTMITTPKLYMMETPRLVMASQIALINALSKNGSRDLFLRWPNDIWTSEGKVGGILEEVCGSGGNISWMNLGIGVNLNQKPKLEKTDTCFSESKDISRQKILKDFLSEFSRMQILAQEDTSELTGLWNSFCMDCNKEIKLSNGETGIFTGIDSLGWCIIKTKKSEKKFFQGEIHYEK